MNIQPLGVNNKFKTQLCKHFSQTGNCPKKNECAFAHGEHELQFGSFQKKPFQKASASQPTTNFKQIMCRYYNEQTGECNCKFESRCLYSHSKEEQRQSQSVINGYQYQMPINQIDMNMMMYQQQQQQQQMAQFNFIQAQMSHKFSSILYQLIPQVEQVNPNQEQIKMAESLNRQGNPLGATEILLNILKDASSEKEQELLQEIENALKEYQNQDPVQIQTMMAAVGMMPMDINQIHQMLMMMNQLQVGMQQNQMPFQ